jgi:hypothetical protein
MSLMTLVQSTIIVFSKLLIRNERGEAIQLAIIIVETQTGKYCYDNHGSLLDERMQFDNLFRFRKLPFCRT